MQEPFSQLSQPGLASPSAAKRDLLQKYLRGELGSDESASRAIARRAPGASQLSFAQERLWFLDQLMPASPVFNVSLAVRFSQSIDLEALQESLSEIVRRHEILRTSFIKVDGRPAPTIASALDLQLRVIELSAIAADEREAECRRLAEEEALRPFDLAQGPLIRTSLIKLDAQQSVFLLTMHHIVSDGWSILLFFQELSAHYQTLVSGKPLPLAEPSIQYADFAAWQRDWLRGEVLERQLAYWKSQLGGQLPILELPADRPRPPVQTYPGARSTLTLSREMTDAMIGFSRREGATSFMTLLAAFKVLLQRYTGQDDVIVGSPIANRPHAETEKLIGFFLNNLALRTDLSGDPSFLELLARVRETALDAYANQDVPFEKVIEELNPDRDLGRTAVFQVYFNFFSFSDDIELPYGETISFVDAWLQSEEHLSKFDLTLYAGIKDGELKLSFVYNTDLFEAASIERMLGHLHSLLASVIAHPSRAISEHALSEAGEVPREVIRPRNAFTEFERAEIEQSIYARFEAQVRLHPERVAVSTKNHKWTYEHLHSEAGRIAQAIVNVCGASEQRVALLCEQDAPMIAAMLGALQAGKTYVPMDPAYPEERLAYILGHSESTVLLADGKNLALARRLANSRLQLINVEHLKQVDPLMKLPEVTPEALAYILYTSGSTGQPKGVIQNHRNVLHFISAYTNNLHISSNDRLTLLSSYCFDASVMDIFGALLNGATLYPFDLKQDGLAKLAEQMRSEGITIFHSTPTVYRYFVETLAEQTQFPRLRLVVLGGEEVRRRDVELYRKHFADECLFVNGLGPTESTVSLQNFIDKQTQLSSDTVPVGFPVAGTEILLLNEAGKPVEIHGEIAIKSQHVALGYWRDPVATKKAFIDSATGTTPETSSPDPRTANSVRLYRTGDFGRRLPDGSIQFEGRRDSQIKLRGYRVELGEIESALCRHSLVRECVVVNRAINDHDQQLVAYVVPHANKPKENDLRAFLKECLPEHMLPAAFVTLESIPLTASGKIDRRALPAPQHIKAPAAPAAPHSALEDLLLPIWSEVLGVPVDIHDNFFESGGHSLLAVRLFAEIEKRLGRRLPLATLFQAPTVAQLAAEFKADSPRWTSLVPIQTAGAKPPFFCVHGLGGNVLEFYDLARHLGADQPFYGLQSQGMDGKQHLHTSVREMAAHYVKEIRELQPAGPYFIGGRSLGGTIAFEMACQLKAAGEEVGLLALFDTYPVGYAKLLPAVFQPETNFGRATTRIENHFRNLRRLSFFEKLWYLIDKARYGPRKIKSFGWRKAYRLSRRLNRRLPRIFRDIAEYNSLAGHEYVPQIYDGRVTLFWASGDLRAYDVVEGWKVLVAGGAEVQEIPGTHLNIIKEPHVAELASKLTNSLARAQGKHLQMTEPPVVETLREPNDLTSELTGTQAA